MYQYKVIKTDKLIPYVNNAREHSAAQVKQIAASIKEFGFTNPILVDEANGVIAGHGRLEAAGLLELQEVPCIILRGLSETQKKAYCLADNQLALNASWNEELLSLEMEELNLADFDLGLLGFESMDDAVAELPDMPDGDKGEFQQITFTLHDEQAGAVNNAIQQAVNRNIETDINTNKNGNAITLICLEWAARNGQG